MRRLATWLFCLFALAQQGTHAAPALKGEPIKDEWTKLEGTWQVVSYISSGTHMSEESLRNYPKMIVKRGVYEWDNGTAHGKILRIDPGAKPKEIDFEIITGGVKGQKDAGIYEIDGDTYRDIICQGSKERPKTFESTAQNGYIMMTYKRVKVEK